MTYADLSHADLEWADFETAELTKARLHRIHEKDTNWRRANTDQAYGTDADLAEAEDWQPRY